MSNSRARVRHPFVTIVLLTSALAGLLGASDAAAACTGFDQESGDHCTAVRPRPWVWWAELGFGLTLDPPYYASLGELIAALEATVMSAQQPTLCSLPLNSITYDSGSIPTAFSGVSSTDIQHQHTLNYTRVWGWQGFECQINSEYKPTAYQGREFFCPQGSGSVFSSGPPQVGPYCARPYSEPDHEKSAGGCQKGGLQKGNPCDVATGNKYQREIDYTGAGSPPLKFERHYNSLLVRGYSASTPRWEPLGVGWSASYFQRVNYYSFGTQATAYVARPDGRTVAFNPSGTAFVAAPDVDERLTAQRDGSGNITGWTLKTRSDDVETYDAAGKLVSIAFRGGTTHTLSYDSLDLLASVSDGFGRQLQFTFDGRHRLTTVTLPGGSTIQYGYTTSNKLTSVTYPGSVSRQYHYENTSNTYYLTGITDESSNRYSTYTYAFHYYNGYQGEAASTEYAGGVNKYEFSNGGTTRTVTDPLGKVRTYGVSTKLHVNRVTSSSAVCQGCGEAKALSYDANANISVRTDFNDVETHYAYDTSRNLETSRTEAYGTARARTITTDWHSNFRLPTEIEEANRTTTFTHDSAGNVLTRTVTDTNVTPNVSRTWTYTYNTYGRVLTEDGPRTDVTDVTTYTYYGPSATCTATVTGATTTGCRGQLETITNALSQITTYNEYNAHGHALKITDANGLVTTLAYDSRQRLTSRDAGGETTALEYWPTGLLKKVIQPDSSFLLYTYDNAHRLSRIDNSEGNYIVYTLDAMGNRTKEETFDPSSYLVRLHHRTFNSFNQLWKEIGSANTSAVTTTFGYDAEGNQTSISAPVSRSSSSLYDELNRLTQITDPASGVTQFGYDANDNLTSVTDPRSKVTEYEYNGFGELTEQTSPDTGVTTNTYDQAGNLNTSTDARSKTGTHSYDALNRLTQIAYADQTIGYSYDTGTNNKGRLMQVTDGSGSTSWTYTSLGRVASRTQVMGSITKAVIYGYNSSGQMTTLTTPSGQTITYAYDNNRVSSVTVNSALVADDVIYDPFGPARQWDWGNSTLAARTYDQDGNVDQIDSAGQKTYSQDDAFRITGIADSGNSALSWTLGFDALDRLTSASRAGQSQTWTYDANGNRLTQGGTTSSTFTISSSSNRLSSISGALSRSYGYDVAGNTTSYGGFTFGYNDAGRLTSVSGSASASYQHNALGQRVKKTVSSTSTYFVYDEAGRLIGEYNGSGTLIQETVWLGDIPVATLRPNGGSISIFYIHTDHLNTPRRISRPSDNVILWRWDSDPFGTDAANQDPDGDSTTFAYNLRFPGQYFDAETGLSYNYFRNYDPAIGRYLESDPIGLRGGLNTYAYAGADPVANIDSTGELFVAVVWGVRVSYGAWRAYRTYRALTAVAAGAAAVASATVPEPLPEAANDPDFGDPNCPPDCRTWREALHSMYHTISRMEDQPHLFSAEYIRQRWEFFWRRVKEYEKACGPYTPPPSMSEIYLR